jgi:hypothetical protein
MVYKKELKRKKTNDSQHQKTNKHLLYTYTHDNYGKYKI